MNDTCAAISLSIPDSTNCLYIEGSPLIILGRNKLTGLNSDVPGAGSVNSGLPTISLTSFSIDSLL